MYSSTISYMYAVHLNHIYLNSLGTALHGSLPTISPFKFQAHSLAHFHNPLSPIIVEWLWDYPHGYGQSPSRHTSKKSDSPSSSSHQCHPILVVPISMKQILNDLMLCRSCAGSHSCVFVIARAVSSGRQCFIVPFLQSSHSFLCSVPWTSKEVMQMTPLGLSTQQSLSILGRL